MKILSPWSWPQGHPQGGDGADENLRPISTIMPNMNEIYQRVFKIWGLINFNAKTLTLWRKDERTYERTYVRTNEWTDELKSENYIPPHTSYVRGIIRTISILFSRKSTYLAMKFGPSSVGRQLNSWLQNAKMHFLFKFNSGNSFPQLVVTFVVCW